MLVGYAAHRRALRTSASTGPEIVVLLGLAVTEITTPDSAYRFRYAGLRLLVSTSEVDVLLPSGWRKGEGSAFLIPDIDGVRLDVIAPP